MLFAIACLIGLSVVVLIMEAEMAPDDTRAHNHQEANLTKKDLCWKKEQIKESEECQPCSDIEIKSGSIKVCSFSKYRQKVVCEKSGAVYRTCDKVVWLEEQHFWAFEGVMALVGIMSGLTTVIRQRTLDHKILQRIQRQLAAGV